MNTRLITFILATTFIVAFGSCKPKQSAYKSVYESAKEREMEQQVQEETVEYTPVNRPATPVSDLNESVKKEKITPVYESDASGLKTYSVVIAAMGMKPNAESLKERMANAGYKVILVQNEQGMYRVIIASADTKQQAVERKREILDAFLDGNSISALKSQYGIPFNDWWILQREF